MTAMFTGPGMASQVVDRTPKGRIPQAMKQTSTMSDLQRMMKDEQEQHMQNYVNQYGHNDGSAPLGTPSF